jgi:succinate dehydrogenase flavin-adding protein (antitoxin of CptAB toxin-antitoxin module)
MKFGLLKSKIEQKLVESYSKNTFKDEVKNFKKFVLENKNIGKLFYLYDQMSDKRGVDKSIANDYVNECITIYENVENKVKNSDYVRLKKWVSDVQVENKYSNIDSLFSDNVLDIEAKVRSRKSIVENITQPEKVVGEVINLPISTLVNVANQTASKYIETLDESDKKELLSLLSENDEKLSEKYNALKENVMARLGELASGIDSDIVPTINETIERVKLEKYDRLNYYRLKSLNESL